MGVIQVSVAIPRTPSNHSHPSYRMAANTVPGTLLQSLPQFTLAMWKTVGGTRRSARASTGDPAMRSRYASDEGISPEGSIHANVSDRAIVRSDASCTPRAADPRLEAGKSPFPKSHPRDGSEYPRHRHWQWNMVRQNPRSMLHPLLTPDRAVEVADKYPGGQFPLLPVHKAIRAHNFKLSLQALTSSLLQTPGSHRTASSRLTMSSRHGTFTTSSTLYTSGTCSAPLRIGSGLVSTSKHTRTSFPAAGSNRLNLESCKCCYLRPPRITHIQMLSFRTAFTQMIVPFPQTHSLPIGVLLRRASVQNPAKTLTQSTTSKAAS